MKNRKDKTRAPILAAGGIVLRGARKPQVAVVQLRKTGVWGLPKGKLATSEDAIAAARREVLEETGYRATIHEFLGTLAYEVSGRPKVVQFWRMEALGEPIGDLMRDVKAVRWLALADAIDQLTHLREQVFLQQVGPVALKLAEQSARHTIVRRQLVNKNPVQRTPSAAPIASFEEGIALAPGSGPLVVPPTQDLIVRDLGGGGDISGEGMGESAGLVPAMQLDGAAQTPESAPIGLNLIERTPTGRTLIERTLLKRTWGWFRHAAMPQRPPLD